MAGPRINPNISPQAEQPFGYQPNFDWLASKVGPYVPDWIKNNQIVQEAPEPIKKIGKFAVESMMPDPHEVPNPLSTALNIAPKTLKILKEETLDTLGKYVAEPSNIEALKKVLGKHPTTGYLGGEGSVAGALDPRAAQTFQANPRAIGGYRHGFSSRLLKDQISSLMGAGLGENPPAVKRILSQLRNGDPALSINEPLLARMKSTSPTGFDYAPGMVEHEMRHVGHDIARGSIMEKFPDLQKKYENFLAAFGQSRKLIPYDMLPPEIQVGAHRTSHPNLIRPGMKWMDRLRVTTSRGTQEGNALQHHLANNPLDDMFFQLEIMPLMKSHK